MKKFSIFTLIRIASSDTSANEELIERYKKYKSKTVTKDTPLDEEFCLDFKNAFFDGINGNFNNLLDILDSKSDSYNEIALITLLTSDDVKKFITSGNFNELLLHLLKEGQEFTTIYFAICLCNFVTYNAYSQDLELTLREYGNSVYFSFHILNCLKKASDYLALHHNIYYQTLGPKSMANLDFYFEYPGEEENSLYYKLAKYNPEKDKLFDLEIPYFKDDASNIEKDLIELINKHNNPLFTYDQVEACIIDFDNYFKNESNIRKCIEIFINNLSKHFDQYPHIVILIMTLLTRCYEPGTIAFAIGATRIFNYYRSNDKLYAFIEKCAHIDDLTVYCIYSLQTHPHFQTICYRLAKLSDGYVHTQALDNLDVNIKKNYLLLRKEMKNQLVRQVIATNTIKKINIMEKVTNPNLEKEDIEFVMNLLIGSVSNLDFGELSEIANADEIIEAFYKNFVETKKVEAHYLNTILLVYTENKTKLSPEIANKIHTTVMDHLIYEDEISYIDEQLSQKNFEVDKVSLMMDYYQYCPEYKLRNLFIKNPSKYLRFLLTLSTICSNEDIIDDCLEALDRNIIIPDSHLQILDNEQSLDTSDETMLEYFKMMMIGDVLSQVPHYYPNLYKLGISYYSPIIRSTFYNDLLKLSEIENITDPELYEIIDNNYQYEDDDSILNIMSSLLGVSRIEVS